MLGTLMRVCLSAMGVVWWIPVSDDSACCCSPLLTFGAPREYSALTDRACNCAFFLSTRRSLVLQNVKDINSYSLFGCRNVVMVPDSHMDPSTTTQADEVLDSLQDFDPTHWGLPAFTD